MPLATPAPDLIERLAESSLVDAVTGRPVRLGDTWAQRAAVLVHLCHFGCLYCRKQVDALKKASPEIEALGGAIVTVGTGDLAYGKRFAEELKLPFRVLVDETMASYRAAGCVETSLVNWVKPGNLMALARTMQMGYRQAKGGLNQQFLGGTHVISPQRVAFAWINDDFAGDAPVARVISALEDLADG